MESKKCFHGHTPKDCPKIRLENEKLIYGALLALTTLVVFLCNIGVFK